MPKLYRSQRKGRVAQGRRVHDDSAFYNSPTWRKFRRYIATVKPKICAMCQDQGFLVQAKYLDHITPIRLGGAPLDEGNVQWLCTMHHAIKSGQEAHKGRGVKNP